MSPARFSYMKGHSMQGWRNPSVIEGLQKTLSPLSPLYEKILAARAALYNLGLFGSRRLPRPVISVGNLITGGTGKTPLVIYIVEALSREGVRLAVLSRGYGGTARERVNLVSDMERVCLGPREAGDEPVLMAKALPGTPVLVGKNRFALGEEAIRRFPVDCLILDDGFQHLPLKRDANLLLLDGVNPFGEEQCLPGGNLREGIQAIHRADIIVLTGRATEETRARVVSLVPDKPLFTVRFVPGCVRPHGSEQLEALSTIRDRRVMAFAGIARTERFFDSLGEAGAIIVGERSFPDHHPYTSKELEWIVREGREKGADYLVTTEKDLVRLPSPSLSPPLLALGLKTEMENGQAFLLEIKKRIQRPPESQPRPQR